MATEQDKTLEGLRFAIQMEIDGKEYYQKSSQISASRLGQQLFQTLAAEEDRHRCKFEQIYREIQQRQTWPEIPLKLDKGKQLRTVFVQATEESGSSIKAPTTELETIQKAMDMENKTYDYYHSQGEKAGYNAERDFYQALMAQERAHFLVLLDYYEYLKNPAAWFTQKEHHSLDGG